MLHEEASKPENRGYADNGDAVLKAGGGRFTSIAFAASDGINPETEVIHSIGSKAALSILPAALVNPGDVVLMTTPGYPVFGTHAAVLRRLGVSICHCARKRVFCRIWSRPEGCAGRAKALVLNYPNNPTGASATPEFFERVVRFAREHRVVVIHDAAYAALVFEGKPLSFLATPGAKEVGVELHSTSKCFQYDRLALRLCGRERVACEGLWRCEGQHAIPASSWPFSTRRPIVWIIRKSPRQIAAKYSRRMELWWRC